MTQAASIQPLLSFDELSEFVPDFARIGPADVRSRKLAACVRHGNMALICSPEVKEIDRYWAVLNAGEFTGLEYSADQGTFERWLSVHEGGAHALSLDADSAPESASTALTGEVLSLARIDAEPNPIVRFLSATLLDALRANASDIHYEATPWGLQVRFRLDGVLTAIAQRQDVADAEKVLSRIKVLSNLDISERRVPQDGRLSINHEGKNIDVRVSIMPSVHGEDAVLRILDRAYLSNHHSMISLESLGLDAGISQAFSRICMRPHGMVMVTGPTGSGKTTTIYAALSATKKESEKIITIEDPVEYQLPGTLQIPVNEKKGLTFARGLRSILRHDPDRILVGEIRDQETAQIAVQAALTGHVVYSTVHANHAFDVLARFSQFGISGYELSSALNGVLSQRLVRMLCPECKGESCASGSSRPNSLGVSGTACPRCRGAGFSGRRAIAELVVVTPELRKAISEGTGWIELEAIAKQQGMISLREHALRLVAEGLTTQEEIDRVTDE